MTKQIEVAEEEYLLLYRVMFLLGDIKTLRSRNPPPGSNDRKLIAKNTDELMELTHRWQRLPQIAADEISDTTLNGDHNA